MIAAILVGGIAAGAAATWLARRAAWRLGVVDRPNPIVPQHVRPVARLGGLGVAGGIGLVGAAAALAGVSLAAVPAGDGWALLLGAIGYLALGTVDDVRPLRPGPKLAAQLGVAIAVVAAAGPIGSSAPGGPSPGAPGLAVQAAAVLWLVAVVNAVNLTDVCDGLVGSLAAASLIAVAAASPAVAPLALAVAAVCAGFLVFNRAPASIFLGDGGSHLLGFAVAGLWLAALHAAPSWRLAGAAVLGAGVFLFELGFLVVVRARRGLPFWRGSPDHLALRLQAAGLSRQQTVAVGVAVAAALAGSGLWMSRAPGRLPGALAAAAVFGLVAAGWRLYAREPVPLRGRPREAEELP